jgi:hypothetical protein
MALKNPDSRSGHQLLVHSQPIRGGRPRFQLQINQDFDLQDKGPVVDVHRTSAGIRVSVEPPPPNLGRMTYQMRCTY